MTKIDPETVAKLLHDLRNPHRHNEELCNSAADMLEALSTRMAELEATKRELAMQSLADLWQAQEAYEAQKAAEAKLAAKEVEIAKCEQEAYIKGLENSILMVREMRATGDLLRGQGLICAGLETNLTMARAAIEEEKE